MVSLPGLEIYPDRDYKKCSDNFIDEATSSVDPENEHLLVEAIEELGKNKTVISIAHRLSTVRKADCIYVISDGSVVREGRHSELMKEDGIYRKFIETRTKSLAWGINT